MYKRQAKSKLYKLDPFLKNGEAIIEDNIVTIADLPVLSDGIQNKEVPALGEDTVSIKNEFK